MKELKHNETYIYKNSEIVYKFQTINYRVFEQDGKVIRLAENEINEFLTSAKR